MSKLSEEIAATFNRKDYKWKFKDGLRTPSAEEVEQMLDTVHDALLGYEHEEGIVPTIIQGRLIVRREKNNHYDVYLMVGSIGEDND